MRGEIEIAINITPHRYWKEILAIKGMPCKGSTLTHLLARTLLMYIHIYKKKYLINQLIKNGKKKKKAPPDNKKFETAL